MTLAFGILAGVLVALYLGFRGCSWLFGELSGWNRLAGTYACARLPAVWTAQRQTVGVGAIRFRRVVDVAVRPEGLYLRGRAIFWFTPLLLPWGALHSPQPQTIYRRSAVRLSVDRPAAATITLPVELFRLAAPCLQAIGGTAGGRGCV